jgi:hypothetical protein
MKFSGRLQIEADPRNWLKTDLNLNHGRLELVSGDDILGSWSTAQVKAERVEGDRFQLHLGDDRAVFAADDALAFSYEALPVLAKKTVLATATNLRGKLRKGLAAVERTTLPDTQDLSEPTAAPVPDPQPDVVESDLGGEVPQPSRKLRDLIQAAVKNNLGETPPAEDHRQWEPGLTPRSTNRAGSDAVADPSPEPGPSAPAWPVLDEATVEITPHVDIVVEQSRVEPSFSPAPAFGDENSEQVRPTFDFSPVFAEPAPVNEKFEHAAPLRGMLDLEATGFENGDTLGERPAERFGWVRASVDEPAVPVEPPQPLIRSLDALIEEVRNSAMSPAQVGAVTDLIRAVTEAIEGKNRR